MKKQDETPKYKKRPKCGLILSVRAETSSLETFRPRRFDGGLGFSPNPQNLSVFQDFRILKISKFSKFQNFQNYFFLQFLKKSVHLKIKI